jgi:lipopolysaccharide export LptBFGC system permease protein LptF
MTVLTTIIAREALRRWLQVLVFGTGLVLFGDFIGKLGFNVSVLLSEHWWRLLLYYACLAPQFLAIWLPLSVLVAAMFTAGPMLKQGTLMALSAAGIPPLRVFAPFLALGLCAGLLGSVLSDQVLPRLDPLAERIRARMKPNGSAEIAARSVGWRTTDGYWIAAAALPEAGVYHQVAVFSQGGRRIVGADQLAWTPGGWRFTKVDVIEGDGHAFVAQASPDELALPLERDRNGMAELLRPDSSRTVQELYASKAPRAFAILCQRLADGLQPLLCLLIGLPAFVRWSARERMARSALVAIAFALIPIAGILILDRLLIAVGTRPVLLSLGVVGVLASLAWIRWRRMT